MEVIICYIVMNMIKIAGKSHLKNVTMVVVTVVCIVLYVQMKNVFEYAPHGFSREEIEDNLSQMPDDVFSELAKKFGV